MITKVAKTLLNDVKADTLRRRALAFAIYVKNQRSTTIFRDFSYREIATIAGVSTNTAKRYITILRSMGLVSITIHKNKHRYLAFKKIRKRKVKNKKGELYHTPKYSDIDLSRLDLSSVKTIEKGLMAISFADTISKIDAARCIIKLAHNPDKFDKLKHIKRAKKVCRDNDWEVFIERSVTYRKIRKMFACGPNMVKKIITTGSDLGLISVYKPAPTLVTYVGWGKAKEALPYYRPEHKDKTLFATRNNIYYQEPLVYRSHLYSHWWESR